MTQENKDILLRLVDRHKALGIADQIDYNIDQFIKDVATDMVNKQDYKKEMVDKWSVKPSLADKLADILVYVADEDEIRTEMIVGEFGFAETSAKRYLRQLTEFGYLEARGGNKNRTYCKSRKVQS